MATILGVEVSKKDVAFAAFSGYMAFSGNLLENGRVILKSGEKIPVIGKVFAVADGVISAVFDSKGNPDKELSSVVGTALTAYEIGSIGAGIGGTIVPIVGNAVHRYRCCNWRYYRCCYRSNC